MISLEEKARKLKLLKRFKKRSRRPGEKIWVNFQVSSDVHKQFRKLCVKHKVNASEYFRKHMEAFILDKTVENKGLKDSEDRNLPRE